MDNLFDLTSKERKYLDKLAPDKSFILYGTTQMANNDLFIRLLHHKFMNDKQYIIGFTGTQRGMTEAQKIVLLKIIKQVNPVECHCGDCIGADAEFAQIINNFNINIRVIGHIPINSSKRAFCKYTTETEPKDYLERNHDIVNQSQIVIATPGEDDEVLRSGTWATIRYTRKQKKPLIVIYPAGNFDIESNV